MTDFLLPILAVIAIIILGIGFALYIRAGNARAQQDLANQASKRKQRIQQEEDRRLHIEGLRKMEVSEDRIRAIKADWEEKDTAHLPKKPRHVLTLPGAIITYECYDIARAPEIDKRILELIAAHPDVNIRDYEKNFGFTLIRLDQAKPKKKVGFIGRD
jgi:hypothetical protein